MPHKLEPMPVIGIKLSAMADLYRWGPWRLSLETDERNHSGRPHIHVRHKDSDAPSASIDLKTMEVIVGEVDPRVYAEAVRVIEQHRQLILDNWKAIKDGSGSIVKIPRVKS